MARDLILGKTQRDWSCGSIVLPAKQQKQIFNKLDDVRYDVRRAGSRALAGLLVLSGALGVVAISNFAKGPHGLR
jgi:hypothetical protein